MLIPVTITLPTYPVPAHIGARSCPGNCPTVCDDRSRPGRYARDPAITRVLEEAGPENFTVVHVLEK